jgi:hypothetical protein
MGNMVWALGDGVQRDVGRQSGHATHLGSCGRGVLVLMPALEPCPPRDRGGRSGGRSCGRGVSRRRAGVRTRGRGERGGGQGGRSGRRDLLRVHA